MSESKSDDVLPLVASSSNPQSGDVATYLEKKNSEVVDLLDSSDDEAEARKMPPPKKQRRLPPEQRESIGSNVNEAICLLDSGDEEDEKPKARASVGSAKNEPIVFSDSDDDDGKKKPFKAPEWKPRFKGNPENSPAKKTRPSIDLESDSSDDDILLQYRVRGYQKPKVELELSDSDEGDNRPKPQRSRFSRIHHHRNPKVIELSDSSDDDVPDAAFSPSKSPKQNMDGMDQSKYPFAPSRLSLEKFESEKNPIYSPDRPKLKAQKSTGPKSTAQKFRLPKRAPTSAEFVLPKRTPTIQGATVPPKAALQEEVHKPSPSQPADSSSPTVVRPPKKLLLSLSGTAHGSHLAPIFGRALAEHKYPQVRNVNHPKQQYDIQRTLFRKDELQKVAKFNSNRRERKRGDLAIPKCTGLERHPNLPTKRLADSTASSFSDPKAATEHINDADFRGGVDPPLRRNVQNGELGIMTMIKHLSSLHIQEPSSLPVHKFSVFGSPDDIIYDFELNIRPSGIPNSGMGVFLTFLGARELKPSKRKLGEESKNDRPQREQSFGEPMDALHPDGFGMAVTLTGEHLKSHHNCPHLLPTLKATLPGAKTDNKGRSKAMKVYFPTADVPYCEEELAGLRDPFDKIGFLGLYREADYVPAPRRTFSSLHDRCGYLDIGRYGPFRKEDRKSKDFFEVKSFLFNREPSEWGFGVTEDLVGEGEQMIDITDDLTGEPHELAKQNIPMYVNEVGHSNSLNHTVHAREKDDRIVEYFVKIKEPMKAGGTIEIFVDYEEHYEIVRERKGYGLANVKGLEKSDEHLGSYIRRNFVERRDIEEVIAGLEPMQIYLMLEKLNTIREGLMKVADLFLVEANTEAGPLSFPTALQLVALRRLGWLAPRFQSRLEELQQFPPPIVGIGIFEQCQDSLSRISWTRWEMFFDVLARFPNLKDHRGFCIKKEMLDKEAVEECCYAVKENLVLPMAESTWCETSRAMTKNLCCAIVKRFWNDSARRASNHDCLLQTFMQEALKAAQEVRGPSDISRLSFDYDFQGDCGVGKGIQDAYQAKLLKNTQNARARVVIGANSEAKAQMEARKPSDCGKELVGIPTPVNAIVDKSCHAQETWYLCWQIIFVVDAFAKKFLLDTSYSLADLCSRLSVDLATASFAIRKGIKIEDRRPKEKRRKRSKASRKDATSVRGANSTTSSSKKSTNKNRPARANNVLFWNIVWPCLRDELGWQCERGGRPNDFYALPPGVTRGGGFRPRVDFFDSVLLVLTFLKTSSKWSNVPRAQAILLEYTQCKLLIENLRGKKLVPKFPNDADMVKWLREQMKKATAA